MEISIEWDFDKLFNLDWSVSSAVQLMLTDISLLIQNSAKVNAPYLTWNLRRSISTDFNKIQRWIAVVWSPVKYARVREYVNNLHPDRRYYLKRAYEDNRSEIINIINTSLKKKLNE